MRSLKTKVLEHIAAALLPLLLTVASLAHSAEAPPPVPASQAPAADSARTAEVVPAAPAVTDPDYLIGPGDTLQIYVWQHTDLTVTIPVRPDGKISTPLVEDLMAVNKTPNQLARDIETVLKEFVRTPQVNVIVTNPANAFNQVRLIGQVRTPGSIAYRAGMTVMDAVLQVGGLSEFAAGNRATLVRKDKNGREERIKVRLGDLINKGKVEFNVELRAGDLVVVPESMF